MPKLKTLQVKALRGLRDLELSLEGRSLLLWGENGSGKSSLVDALEFLFHGTITHLEGTRGISLQRHGPHVELGQSDLQVTADFDPGPMRITRTFSKAPSIPDSLKGLWEACQRTAFLRRAQLLSFIHADPSERFRAIGDIIGVGDLDGIELTMMRVRDRFEGLRGHQRNEVGATRQQLGKIIGTADATPEQVLARLNEEATGLGLSPLKGVEAVSEEIAEWLRSTKQTDQDRISQLNTLQSRCRSLDSLRALPDRLQKQKASFDALVLRRESMERLSEAELLAKGLEVLGGSGQWDTCPLCEHPIDQQAVAVRLRERHRVLQELSSEFSTFRSESQALAAALSSAEREVLNLQAAVLNDYKDAESTRRTLAEVAVVLQQAAEAVGEAAGLNRTVDLSMVQAAVEQLLVLGSTLASQASEQLAALALTERDRTVLTLVQRANELKAREDDLDRQNGLLQQYSEWHRRASYTYNTFSACKKDEIRSVFTIIEADVRRFYERLHPGESHTDFRLILAEGKRASAELQINAFGRSAVDPRALASEGHLDSLGLCIFLAFAKNFANSAKFMVLDDVIMSIDSTHRSEVAALLLDEFKDWQLVLTTHDEIWFEEFCRHQAAYSANGRFSNLRIIRWNLAEGPVLQGHKPRWERIEEKLQESDKPGSGNEGRQYLEWVLHEICITTMASIPAKRVARYTAEELIVAARSRLLSLLPAKKGEIDSLFQAINAAGMPGNLLSHSNANALAVSMAEIRRFCESAKALHDWFACPCCGRFPVYIQQAHIIRCCNPKCKAPVQWATS